MVIVNGRELCVFDFNHEVSDYTVLFSELLDGNMGVRKNWAAFLSDFCVPHGKAKEKKRTNGDAGRHRKKIKLQQSHVICGDCVDWLEDIPPASIDMCYIDPPFFSNRNHEIIWGNGYELRSFEDRWKGGILAYIEWMEERVKLIHRCLKDTGSIFLHCDWRASHRLRVMLDEVFGEKNFVNEIIWCYAGGGASKRWFSKKHDVILFYAKTNMYMFNILKEKRTEKSLKRLRNPHGARIDKNKIIDWDKRNIVDYWMDIQIMNPMSNERIGYKTQKPEALLNRIISCSTNENDVVLDCFAGGGTTAAVAIKLKRRFIVGDVSPVAVRVISDRLSKIPDTSEFNLLNVPRTKSEWLGMDGHTFAEKICEFMGWECNPKKSDDGGIDGWANKGSIPVQIKNHKNSVGINPIKHFYASLGKASKGIFVAWSFARKAEEYRAIIQRDEGKEIIFMTVSEILGSILINDEEKNKLDELYRKNYKKAA